MPPPRPRSVVERIAGYTPGEQPRPGERVIKLNTNENPFPPSPRVVDAIRLVTADDLRRYPSSMADDFRAVAARVHGVSPENIWPVTA
jgi:histidinol-phosphate aminotransferase